jgi:hypothetical protein
MPPISSTPSPGSAAKTSSSTAPYMEQLPSSWPLVHVGVSESTSPSERRASLVLATKGRGQSERCPLQWRLREEYRSSTPLSAAAVTIYVSPRWWRLYRTWWRFSTMRWLGVEANELKQPVGIVPLGDVAIGPGPTRTR